MGTFILSLYFRFFEALVLALPPNLFGKVVFRLGHFRPRCYQDYRRSVLTNLAPFFPDRREEILREMLRLETSLVAEKGLIARKPSLVEAYFANDLPYLPAPAVVVSGHLCNFWLLVDLLRLKGQPVVMVIGRRPSARPSQANEKSGWRAWLRWRSAQEFIYVSEGGAYDKCRRVLEEGKRIFLLLDVPRPHGHTVTLLGRRVCVMVGGLKLASELDLPVIALLPYPPRTDGPYHLKTVRLHGTDWVSLLEGFMRHLEEVIRAFPFSWIGWLYFEKLVS